MADIFISYKRARRDEVSVVAARLEGLGVSVWFDAGLVSGDQFRKEIKKQLASCSGSIACWTPECFADGDEGWVRWEAQFARHRGRLLPVLLSPTELEPPFHLDHVEDLTGWAKQGAPSDHNGWQRLLLAIESKVSRVGELCELDRALEPARRAGIYIRVDSEAAEVKTAAAKLDPVARQQIYQAFLIRADENPKSASGKRMRAIANALKPDEPKPYPARLERSAPSSAQAVPGPQLNEKGRAIISKTKIRTFAAIAYGYSLLKAAPQLLLCLAAVTLALNLWNTGATQGLVQDVLEAQTDVGKIGAAYVAQAATLLFSLFVGIMVQTSLLRALIRGEGVSGILGLNFGVDELRVLTVSAVMLLVAFLPQLIQLAAVQASQAGYNAWIVASLLAAAILQIIVTWVLMRSLPIAATVVARKRFAIDEGWRLSEGAFWSIFGAAMILGAPVLATSYAYILLLPYVLGFESVSDMIANGSPFLKYGWQAFSAMVTALTLPGLMGVGAYVFVQRSTVATREQNEPVSAG